jgi:polysaccharide biosynthesis transport protein
LSVDEGYQKHDQVAAHPARHAAEPQLVSGGIDLGSILDFARRRLWVILFSALFMSTAGFTYFIAAPAPYVGKAILRIDTRKFQLFQLPGNQPGSFGDQMVDAGADVEGHIEALKSEDLALKVITELHLADDAEFGLAAAIPVISNLIETRNPASEAWRVRNALRIFEKRLTIERQGIFLIAISFESANAERAAQIANAVAQSYITGQLDAKYAITRQGSKWLERRISELRDQVSTAERAVIDYKAEHKIVDAGNGRLTTEQQATDLNNRLTAARTKTSEMRARLGRIDAALNDRANTNLVNATADEALSNLLIVKLRTQYIDLATREAELSEKYGADHLAVVSVRDNMRRIRGSILNELQRLREAYKSDYEFAREAEELINKQLLGAIAESHSTNEAQVKLANLETSAATLKTLYDNFVRRYAEASEQQSFPYTEARVITEAVPPIKRTYRKSLLIVAMTPFIGLVFGIGLGALLDFLDRGFRTSSEIEAMLGLACIALVPLQRNPADETKNRRAPTITGPRRGLISSELGSIVSSVVEQPFSQFAEAIRTIKLAADLNGISSDNKVVGITSALPGEGKSTISAALAISIARAGGRVLLVDCDLRNPSLSRALAPSADLGILEVLSGRVALDEALCREVYLSMAFLPVRSKSRIADSSELLSSNAMKRLFERLRHSYDYIIVDLPPLAPLADVRATTHLVDSYLFVVEWGGTSTSIVRHALRTAPRAYERIVGAVLNKVDMKALSLYDGSRAGYYHNKSYGRYGYTD